MRSVRLNVDCYCAFNQDKGYCMWLKLNLESYIQITDLYDLIGHTTLNKIHVCRAVN